MTLDESERADVTVALRKIFKEQAGSSAAGDVVYKETLGQGHFGRVRLIEWEKVRMALKPPFENHSGFFALKIMKKSEVLRLKQTQHVLEERKLLYRLKNPFIVSMYHTYQDERNLYMVMEYVPGGELRTKLELENKFENDVARFYTAQLVLALQYMHSDGIVYRGLVPDNLLLDASGYLKLVDFGFAKALVFREDDESSGKTYTLCGTAEYLAPEVVSSKGHGKGADWWAVGIITYEMLAGYPPFHGETPYEIYTKILKGDYTCPRHFEANAETLITKLLKPKVPTRLGCTGAQGAEQIKQHKWFRGLNWASLYNKNMGAPFEPELRGDGDASYFGNPDGSPKYPDSIEESGPLLTEEKNSAFANWA
jgi:protein kinase X